MAISPGLEAAIARLAKVTVQTGADPGKVIATLIALVRFRNEVWPSLTPYQRYAYRVRLRHLREEVKRRGHADSGDAGAE
jgi:hypothetical protein